MIHYSCMKDMEKKMNIKPLLIAGVLIGAALAVYTALPKTGESIAPDTVITETTGATVPVETPAVEPEQTAAMVTNPDGEALTPRSPIATYASKEQCEAATHRECHDVICKDVPAGQTAAAICGPDFEEGWQAIVPTADSAAIPEIIAPPLEESTPPPAVQPAP